MKSKTFLLEIFLISLAAILMEITPSSAAYFSRPTSAQQVDAQSVGLRPLVRLQR